MARTPEQNRKNVSDWQKKNPAKVRAKQIKYRYGITAEDYFRMHADQNGKCAICDGLLGSQRRTHIDHDHLTGKVRGLLCPRCNLGIGYFRDDPSLFRKVCLYLERE